MFSLLQMDYIKNSPSKFTTCFQDHLQSHVQKISVRMETCDKQRQLDALSLSARKSIKFRTKSSESTMVARTLFQNSLNMKGSNIRNLLQDNIKTTLREVINNVASPIANKRKYSNILNDNRRNYEAVDLSVDLCCANEEDDSEQRHKKIRMSVWSIQVDELNYQLHFYKRLKTFKNSLYHWQNLIIPQVTLLVIIIYK